jgi:transposase InsO family protein
MTASMSCQNHDDDNALMESGHSLLKAVRIDRTLCRTGPEIDIAMCAAIKMFYHRKRTPRVLGYSTPTKTEAAYRARTG